MNASTHPRNPKKTSIDEDTGAVGQRAPAGKPQKLNSASSRTQPLPLGIVAYVRA